MIRINRIYIDVSHKGESTSGNHLEIPCRIYIEAKEEDFSFDATLCVDSVEGRNLEQELAMALTEYAKHCGYT